jgi:hypothetical protein
LSRVAIRELSDTSQLPHSIHAMFFPGKWAQNDQLFEKKPENRAKMMVLT